MTVYVDDAKLPYRGMIMCHMAADSLGELHTFAARIGLERTWFQNGRLPHYDLSVSMKLKALSFGAVSVDARHLAKLSRKMAEATRK